MSDTKMNQSKSSKMQLANIYCIGRNSIYCIGRNSRKKSTKHIIKGLTRKTV
jgi:hypothetical protein